MGAAPAERLSADARRGALLDGGEGAGRRGRPGRRHHGDRRRPGRRDPGARLQALRQQGRPPPGPVPAGGATARPADPRPRRPPRPTGFEPKLRAFIGATPRRRRGARAVLHAAAGHRRRRHAPRGPALDATGARSATSPALAERDFGIDLRTARSVIAVLFSGIRSLLSQMRSRPGAAQRQFLLDTYVEMTLGALHPARRSPALALTGSSTAGPDAPAAYAPAGGEARRTRWRGDADRSPGRQRS